MIAPFTEAGAKRTISVRHPLDDMDAPIVAAAREQLAPVKGQLRSPEVRGAFDAIMEQVAGADGVSYETGSVGGISGVWAIPHGAAAGSALLHLHGGAYILGSPWAYRHFAGQIAARAQAASFLPDYRLAPEQPFPAALDDAVTAFRGLRASGYRSVAVIGDSAGGGLALALAASSRHSGRPSGIVAISPWGDLTLSGSSIDDLADIDPLLTREMLATTADLYLAGADPRDPRASPVLGPFDNLPPVQLHVGGDEVLLDDARRYAAGIDAAGGRAEIHVWDGMAHVFPSSAGLLRAADSALALIGKFLREVLVTS